MDSNYKTFLKEKKHKSKKSGTCTLLLIYVYTFLTGMSPHDQKVHEFTKLVAAIIIHMYKFNTTFYVQYWYIYHNIIFTMQ